MISEKQRKNARLFSAMHKNPKMFVIPNAWDVGSAFVFEKQGFPAVATSSAGIAYSLGYPDGEDISFGDLVWIVEKIADRLEVPVSVDFERGYTDKVDDLRENARALLFAGAVGFNIEDGLPDGSLCPLDQQLDKIKVLANLKKELDIDFVINARTCAYWLNVADSETMMRIACERGNAFAKAGADCVFIPGGIEEKAVVKLVKNINVPINIILNGEFNDFAALDKLGVRRLSVGSAPVRYIYNRVIAMAEKLKHFDTADLLANTFTYTKANAYFRNPK